MTAASPVPPGSPCWIDLMTSDTDQCRAFYGALLGWTAGEGSPEFGGYFMFLSEGVPVAGAMPTPPGMEAPDAWGVYLAVANAAEAVQAVLDNGGTVSVEPMAIADLGVSVVTQDPAGARIGLWQAETFAGFGASGRPGAPSWFELLTPDYDKAVAYYRDALGWDAHVVSDAPEFRYTTLGKEEQSRAGIMDAAGFLAPGAAGEWVVYFGVEDVDRALTQVTALGGALVEPAMDTPYGRMATVTDPSGARFKLHGPVSS